MRGRKVVLFSLTLVFVPFGFFQSKVFNEATPLTRIHGISQILERNNSCKDGLFKHEVFGPVAPTLKSVVSIGFKWVFVQRKI